MGFGSNMGFRCYYTWYRYNFIFIRKEVAGMAVIDTKEAQKILGSANLFKALKKSKKLVPVARGFYDKDLVSKLANEAEERRKIKPPRWIHQGSTVE